eukprot:TRINITY_DN3045_c0_g1_i3.p2 TRINITY_DN3045_c0_g1~~TRINITY_DN3045_c0_g1_i3.p2  ORF type:complete len:193 (-),score=45.39 TRINITY_DN3045_c0_g1_i3:502-1080(-)
MESFTEEANDKQYAHWVLTAYELENFQHAVNHLVEQKQEPWRFLRYQLEKCPDTGRMHYQDYVWWKRDTRFQAIKKKFNDESLSCHAVRPKNGDTLDVAIAKARNYVKKEESRVDGPWEYGMEDKKSGDRTDLKRAAELISQCSEEEDMYGKEELHEALAKYPKFCSGLFNYNVSQAIKNWQDEGEARCDVD